MGKRRRSVLALPMMIMVRKTPEKLGGGVWGALAKRFPGKTRAYSPKLLAYRACMQAALAGSKPGSIGAVQKAFKEQAHKCKTEVAGKPTIKKVRSLTYV